MSLCAGIFLHIRKVIIIKHETGKKTAIYKPLSIFIGFLVPYLLTCNIVFTLKVGFFTELSTLILYYSFEKVWRLFVKKKEREELEHIE